MLEIIIFVLVILGLGHLIFNYRPGRPFSHREMKVFDKYVDYRDELATIKNRVSPPSPKPDYSLTLGLSTPKPSPAANESPEKE